MRLNTLSPAEGSKSSKKRVGRGIGSGLGKTCGKVTKAKSRDQVGFIRSTLKVVKCLYKDVCRKRVLRQE